MLRLKHSEAMVVARRLRGAYERLRSGVTCKASPIVRRGIGHAYTMDDRT
jgi:hypothetical protein